MSFLKTIFKSIRLSWLEATSDVKNIVEENDRLNQKVAALEFLNTELEKQQKRGNMALLLTRYNLSRMKLMETGGFLDIDVDGLARIMMLALDNPKPIRDEVYKVFGEYGLSDSADRMLTGDIYEEGDRD